MAFRDFRVRHTSPTPSRLPRSPTASPSQGDQQGAWNPIVQLQGAGGWALLQEGVPWAAHHILDLGKEQHQVLSYSITVDCVVSLYVLVKSKG